MTARLVHDQSRFIEAALAEVRRTALLGAGLGVGVLFLFLGGLRATGLVVVAIPLSILATFLPMFIWGTTLNLISMGGLALGVGMLVDNSIVVLEAIHRLREQGLSPLRAAREGLREVGWGRAHFDYENMSPLRESPPLESGRRIAVGHGHWLKTEEDAHRGWLITDEDIASTGAAYVALGHWPQAGPAGDGRVPAYYCGSPDLAATVNAVRLRADGGVDVERVALAEHGG